MFGAVAKAKKAYEPISAIQQPVTMEVDPILEPSVTKQHGTVAGLSSNQLSSMRMKAVRAALLFLYKRDRSDTVTMDDVAAELEVRRVANDLSPADLRKALKQLDNDNSIMLTGSNSIIRI